MAFIKREIKIVNGVEKLRCSKCNYWLTFDEFSNDKHTSTGKRAYCKCCQKKYNSGRRKREFNSGLIGLYLETCIQCKTKFTTKSSSSSFCSKKCSRRWYYEKNEQTETAKLFGRSKVIYNINKMREVLNECK